HLGGDEDRRLGAFREREHDDTGELVEERDHVREDDRDTARRARARRPRAGAGRRSASREVYDDLCSLFDAEELRGAAPRDREGEAAVAVLVEDERAARGVRERAGGDGEEPLAARGQLDPRAGREVELLELVAPEVERDVAEPVDGESGRADPVLSHLGPRNLDANELV